MLMTGQPILQFGTSRFLQAHVDLFVSEGSEALGGITVVQGTDSPASTRRAAALAGGYDVLVRGLRKGVPVEERVACHSVREVLHARRDWDLLRARARGPVQVIVSNTGDSGWATSPGETAALLAGNAPAPDTFPARLLVLLNDRWLAQPRAALTLLPCELVSRNGDALRNLIVALARHWGCSPAFVDWLQGHVLWANSLVDRIVSEPLEPAGAVTEPYALWAIEAQRGLQLPCRHPAIVLTDDLARYERLKLFLLNLGHTLLAEQWLRGGYAADMTVLQAMGDARLRDPLEQAWQHEVLPVFEALGQGQAAHDYLAGLRDRLLNPFLAHRLADIAQNHPQKKLRRLQPVADLARVLLPALDQPLLRAALGAA